MDSLIVQCYAPGHSRFNPIERSWSYLTKQIVGVTLPDTIEGVVPAAGDDETWHKVLDNATIKCTKFWHNKHYAGFQITVESVLSSSDPIIPHIKATPGLLKTFADASAKKIRETPELLELQSFYQFFVKHANRKAYQLEFFRCTSPDCSHCSSLPLCQYNFLDITQQFGGTCPCPEISEIYPGHYKTFITMLQNPKQQKKDFFNPTEHGVCMHGCSYLFFI